MSWGLGSEDFEREIGEVYHKKGRPVWLLRSGRVTVNPRGNRVFGVVEEDSIYPATTVRIDIRDKDQALAFWNKDVPAHVKREVEKRNRNRKRGPRGPKVLNQ